MRLVGDVKERDKKGQRQLLSFNLPTCFFLLSSTKSIHTWLHNSFTLITLLSLYLFITITFSCCVIRTYLLSQMYSILSLETALFIDFFPPFVITLQNLNFEYYHYHYIILLSDFKCENFNLYFLTTCNNNINLSGFYSHLIFVCFASLSSFLILILLLIIISLPFPSFLRNRFLLSMSLTE